MSVATEPATISARKVRSSLDSLCDPGAEAWDKASETTVELEPTPLDLQPSAYVRASWEGRRRGDVSDLRVRALLGTDSVAVRLDWPAPRPVRRIADTNVYADACAVLLPVDGRTLEIESMGSPEHPVEAWHWRAGTAEPFVVRAEGIGTADRAKSHAVLAAADWVDRRWRVVLARRIADPGAPIATGASIPVAFAIWSGVSGERAGLKSFSPRSYELALGD